MLGRLARWMRLLGYDTLYFKDTDYNRLILKADNEGRIILTRNNRLKKDKGVFLIRSENIKEQIKEVTKNFPGERKFSRCSLCNTALEKVPKERVKDMVPRYTFRTHRVFYLCPKCKKVYWRGSHIKLMEEFLKDIG